jgi:hypothetical protein
MTWAADCLDCPWSTNRDTEDSATTAAIHHYVFEDHLIRVAPRETTVPEDVVNA